MSEILPILWSLLAGSFVLVPARTPRLRLAAASSLMKPVGMIGQAALSFVGRAAMRAPPAVDPVACGTAIVLAIAGWSIAGAPAAVAFGIAPLVVAGLKARASVRSTTRAIEDDLPEVIDLLRLAVGAGLTASLAVATVAGRAPGPVGAALRSAVRQTHAGQRLGNALDAEAAATEGAQQSMVPLLAALADAARDGSPLALTLDRLAAESRAARRRRAEERARRVPVLLLLPLVCCTLPAVGLLTVIPVAAGAVRSLRS